MKQFHYESTIAIESVSLNVQDLAAQVAFYHKVIGLDIIALNEQEATLGVDGNVLLHLFQINVTHKKRETGLYHTAFLLPQRKDLANVLRYFIDMRQALHGASDHGYSEAIYLEDVEGNGIEIYVDKPRSEWERNAQGKPIGKTEMLDVEDLLRLAEPQQEYKMPNGSIVGHVHFKVIDVSATTRVYQEVLPIEAKFVIPTASFLAGGDYHHHFAFNQWERGLSIKESDTLGLRDVTVKICDRTAYDALLQEHSEHVKIYEAQDVIMIEDLLNGIRIRVKWVG